MLLKAQAQVTLEPIIGYAYDLRNKPALNQFNTALQFAFYTNKSNLLVKLQRGWAIAKTIQDPIFTNDPSLPQYATADKTLSAQTSAIELGLRVIALGHKEKSHLSVSLYFGLSHQAIKVIQDYDKTNYAVFTPDISQSVTGIILEAGAEYTKAMKFGDLLLQLTITTPPTPVKFDYSGTYKLMVPLSLNIGYSIPLSAKTRKDRY